MYSPFIMVTKIVHLSDLHLGKKGKHKIAVTKPQRDLALGKILSENPDAIIISGDLTKFGNLSDYQYAAIFLEELEEIAPVLKIPGNTDYTTTWYRVVSVDQDNENEEPEDEVDENEERESVKIEKIQFLQTKYLLSPEARAKFGELPYLVRVGNELYDAFTQPAEGVDYSYSEKDLKYFKEFFGEETEPTLSINGINFIGIDSQADIRALIVAKGKKEDTEEDIFLGHLMDGRIEKEHLEKRLESIPDGINIAVMHHPPLKINGANPLWGSFYEGIDVVEGLSKRGIRFVLSGHKHIPGCEILLEKENNFYVCSAGTLFSRDIKKPFDDNSYNVMTFDGNNVTVFYRELKSGNSRKLLNFDLE